MLTVVTAPTSRRLTTVDHVKALAQVAGASDATINLLIDQASAAIEKHLGYPLGAATYDEEFFGYGAGLILSRGPVIALTSVTVGGVALSTGDYANDLGTIYRKPLSRWRNCGYAWNGAIVRYTAGYVLPNESGPTLPADIERAAILTVGAMFSGGSRDPNLRSEMSEGVGSWTYATGDNAAGWAVPSAEASALLQQYRVPVFA